MFSSFWNDLMLKRENIIYIALFLVERFQVIFEEIFHAQN